MNWQALQAHWQKRSARERKLLWLAAAVLGLALLWPLGVAPALSTWLVANQRQAEIDLQTRQMLQLQGEARQLKTPARVQRQEAIALLESSAANLLGKDARLQVQGDVLRVSLVAAPAKGLAQWLAQAREKALALPHSARLEQVAPAPSVAQQPAATQTDTREVGWRGELLLRLP